MRSLQGRVGIAVVTCLALSGCRTPRQDPGVRLAWCDAQAEQRQVVEVTAKSARQDCAVGLPLTGPAGVPFRIAMEEQPDVPLPVFRDADGTVCVRVPGAMAAGQTRRVLASWSKAPGWAASPVVGVRPEDGDEYAFVTFNDAWDFDEGDQEGIARWGDNPTMYGKISVENGMLIVPVTGNDPYLIWGNMFGPSEPGEGLHIDSKLYTTLSLRVKQSCARAKWTLYLTDGNGVYKGCDVDVAGTEFQVLRFDLAALFPGFWDGREFRAVRIDTTNNQPGATVEIDWVRLNRAPVHVTAGPVFTAAQVEARERVTAIRARLPRFVQAGEKVPCQAAGLNGGGKAEDGAPIAARLVDGANVVACGMAGGGASAPAVLDVGGQIGERTWLVGVCDDLGRPAQPMLRLPVTVTPAALDHYELIPARTAVPVTRREVSVLVWAADRFGNHLPVDVRTPQWSLTGGVVVTSGELRGAPATVAVTCAETPRTRHEIVLRDAAGHEGRTVVTTLAYRKDGVTLNARGWFVDTKGELYLPLGGFYANWPSGLPGPDGALNRSTDLFPCGPSPYTHGFPWPPEVEKQVQDYLGLCHRHGVTGLRLMLRNMDIVGRVDPVQLKAVLHLFDLARPLGIRFDVALFEDYTKPPYVSTEIVEKIVLPQYTADELRQLPPHRARFLVRKDILPRAELRYTDADAIRCQKDYLDELLPYLAEREEVLCYEFENEMVFPPMSWVNEITAYIRAIDPHTPILGNPGPHDWPEPWRWRDAKMDLFSYHPYNDGCPGADHGAVMFMRSKWAAAAGFPMFTGEGGINQNRWQKDVKKVSPECAMRGIRDQIWLSMCAGANGAFMWTADHEWQMAEFGKVTTAVQALGVDLRTLTRRQPRTVLVMPADKSANANAYALGYALLSRGVDFDTRPAEAAGGYASAVDAVKADPATLSVAPELFEPATGYQVCYLATADLDQVVIYLRNIAGGIVDQGGGARPCYVREPKPALAAVRLLNSRTWPTVTAFDLDDAKVVPATVAPDGRLAIGAGETTHDFVIGLRRAR
ncbi:MAG: hypothetical protein A3K19_12635 [Lentisphaerae bacterium RIFOXYB12_FULL_65_16]|nr:MAG: hypothetical protein A3K18_24415 [Lentisphaerae bacterium RIFOXYA12_64_32]OGV88070.1 MAG: hypothetical protein A3K19_12635 [Lentisphaerae bacterium RIFOXYB12_FULL_65_16]